MFSSLANASMLSGVQHDVHICILCAYRFCITYTMDYEDIEDHSDFQYRPGTKSFVLPILLMKTPSIRMVKLLIILLMDSLKFGGMTAILVCYNSDDWWDMGTENNGYCRGGSNDTQIYLAESQILTNIEKARAAISYLE
uniref:Uncharacterized protein n=1 Tax=Glossina palpalis gambiensis TaxID=67801 RepID=A0A1B0C3F9_9MUSC